MPSKRKGGRSTGNIIPQYLSPQPDEVIYILAGDLQQANDWRRRNKLSGANCIYIDEPDQLRGLDQPAVVIVGTFWERSDFRNFLHVIRPSRPRLQWSQIEECYTWYQRIQVLEEDLQRRLRETEALPKEHKHFKTIS